MFRNSRILVFLSLMILTLGCNETKFRRGAASSDSNQNSPKKQECKESQSHIGAKIVFVIDNSASNSETDCHSSQGICDGITHRETAVLRAFDYLVDVEKDAHVDQSESSSSLAVVSFPRRGQTWYGAQIETQNFIAASAENRDLLAKSLEFTRRPSGGTPIKDGVYEAANLIHSINQDTRQPLIVLVTDGESTDLNAAQVKPQIKDSLAAVGADLLTVSVTSGKTRDERLSEHAQYLESMRFSRNDIDAIAGTKDSPTFVEDISSEYLEIDHIDDLSESLENLIERKTSCD